MEKNYQKEFVEQILNGEVNYVEYDAAMHLAKKGYARTEFLLDIVDVEGTKVPIVRAKLVDGNDARIYSDTLWPYKDATKEQLGELPLGRIDTFDLHVGFAVVIDEKTGKKVIKESTPKVSAITVDGITIRFAGEKRVAPEEKWAK